MRIFNKTTSNERGYTMIEVLLYISILGVLGIVLTNYAYRGFTRYRTGRVAQQILELKRAILQYTAVYDNYLPLNIEDMHTKRALPLDMRYSTTEARHALGGAVTLGPASELSYATASTDNNYMFYITFHTMKKSSCVEILTQGQFYSDGGDLDSVLVSTGSGTSETTPTYFYYEHSFFAYQNLTKSANNKIERNRLTVEQAERACSDLTQNNVTWIFS